MNQKTQLSFSNKIRLVTGDLFGSKKSKISRNLSLIGGMLLLILLGVGIRFVYKGLVSNREQKAFKEFSRAMDLYTAARTEKSAAVDWGLIKDSFQQGYQNHTSSYLAPYFLLFEANSLIQAGDTESALLVVEKAADDMKKQPLYSLVLLKKALLMLDSGDKELVERGIEEIHTLASDTNNIYSDAALYHLGRYFWVMGDIENARVTWLELFDRYDMDQTTQSIWASRAYELFQTIE